MSKLSNERKVITVSIKLYSNLGLLFQKLSHLKSKNSNKY